MSGAHRIHTPRVPTLDADAESAAPLPGALVGRTLVRTYRLDRLITCGGMGAIYEGLHLRLQRRIAVKMLLPEHARSPNLVEHFRREAELTGRAEHPNIVQVLDVDTAETGLPFFVMEYLDGRTLHERLRAGGPLPLLEAVRIVSEVAAALAQVHAHGIVHCDVKPANVFLVEVPEQPDFVKMIDFGVSTETGRAVASARPTEIAGTPSYMAPEQALGRHPLDARTDQFSLAAIAYELVSGQRAFVGADVQEVLDAVVSGRPRALSELAPWVPSIFDEVLQRALAKQPEARFSSVSAFAWALENAVREAGIEPHREEDARGKYSLRPMATEHLPARRSSVPVRASEPPAGMNVRAGSVAPREASPSGPSASDGPRDRLRAARHLCEEGRLDEAAEAAEALLEEAVTTRSPEALGVLAAGAATLDAIFEARAGGDDQMLGHGPTLAEFRYTLSPRAAQLVARVDEPMTLSELVQSSGMPRRDCVRLIAGLLRRGVLLAR